MIYSLNNIRAVVRRSEHRAMLSFRFSTVLPRDVTRYAIWNIRW